MYLNDIIIYIYLLILYVFMWFPKCISRWTLSSFPSELLLSEPTYSQSHHQFISTSSTIIHNLMTLAWSMVPIMQREDVECGRRRDNCEGNTTPYNGTPFPGMLLGRWDWGSLVQGGAIDNVNHYNIDTPVPQDNWWTWNTHTCGSLLPNDINLTIMHGALVILRI